MLLDFLINRNRGGKPRTKWSPDLQKLHMDFFCQLTYMSITATSGATIGELFYHSARLPYVSARYFQRVNFVARAFNHAYSEACRIVGESTKEEDVKAFLLRLSGTLKSGENIVNFLEREAEVASQVYGNHYERGLEVLRKWSDAYVALIMTSAIVTVMAVVTMIIGTVTVAFILGLGTLTVIVTIAGVWLMYGAAPREAMAHSLPLGSREQNIGRILANFVLPLGLITVLASFVLTRSMAWNMLIASVFLFPLGLVSFIDDQKIGKRDLSFAGLVRSLGAVSQTTNVTISEALGRLDSRSMGTLKENVALLYTRELAGIEPHLCWERFTIESGSEQVNRGVGMFLDSIALGAEPELVGNKVSAFSMKISMLRAKRKLVDSGFLWLASIMHIVLVFLVVFVYQTITSFSSIVQKLMPNVDTAQLVPGIPSFGIYNTDSVQMNMLYFMVTVVITVLTLANAIAIHACSGGHIRKLAFYLAFTMATSGGVMLVIPPMVKVMFASFE